MNSARTQPSPDAILAELLPLSPAYAQTPLLEAPRIADRLRVAQVLIKDESKRTLGSFKSLGGAFAGLRALSRAAGLTIDQLRTTRPANQPALICASDGNHGLAVAFAARHAGARAQIYLHHGVAKVRAQRIEDQGADIVWIHGTYDDAVLVAREAARSGVGILIADTTEVDDDPVVADVMAGYGVIAAEIQAQVERLGREPPTHLVVQAGVGGLAAALAEGLAGWLASPQAVVVVEPAKAPCVTAALAAGRPMRVEGDLETAAVMLSCGEASAPALAVLRRYSVYGLTVGESTLNAAPRILVELSGPPTTPSGAAGLAGLLRLAENGDHAGIPPLAADSRILMLVTEGVVEETL